MSDIGLAGGVGEEQISDSGLSDAQSFTDFSPSGSDGDSYAQASANILAEPIAGRNRSNITNLVDARTGQSLYDPVFAAALKISRGLNPGADSPLTVPSYLQPQVPGNKVLNEAGDRMMYGSPVERFFQEDFTDFVRSSQQAVAGIPSLYSLGIDAIKRVLDGASFLNNSKAGKTVEEAAEDEKRIEITNLQTDMTDPNFKPIASTTVDKVSLDKLDDRPSIAELAEQRKRQNALNAISDMFDNKGIVSLSQADKIINELKNQQIAAGTSKGTDLSFDPYSSAENFQKAKDLGILNEFGLTAAEQAKVDFSSRGFAEDPKDRPRDPNNPGGTMLTFLDPINDPVKAPPGFVDIVMREGKSPTFAGTNISIFGGRDPSAKLYSPLTEAEAQAQIDTGFSLEPIPYDFPLSLSPRDFTGSGVRAGVDLTPADFRVEQSDPEKVMRVPKSSLPASAQELASLRSGELDYGTSFPLQTILDARREKRFTQKELGDLLAGFKR